MNFKTSLSIAVLLLIATQALSQAKFEKEYRLKLSEVPLEARKFVNALHLQAKVRWYFEENLKANSIEAKVTTNQQRYSFEFDTLGNFQDVEVQIKWHEIPQVTRNAMAQNLCSRYSYYKINKMQVQHTGGVATVLALLKSKNTINWPAAKYEIIVKGKKHKLVKLYEIVFSQTGEIITASEIIFRNIDNLAF